MVVSLSGKSTSRSACVTRLYELGHKLCYASFQDNWAVYLGVLGHQFGQ